MELLKAIPKTESARSSREGKSSTVLPAGVSYKTSHHAQTIANNPDKVEVANELYVAREKLSSRERTSTGTFVPMDKSWNQYCQDIGIEKRTANRWLAQFFPVKQRMIGAGP